VLVFSIKIERSRRGMYECKTLPRIVSRGGRISFGWDGKKLHLNQRPHLLFAFKKNADQKVAEEDFGKIDIMFKKLKYPIGFFINIDRYPDIFLDSYDGDFKDRIHEFCIKLDNGLHILHAFFKEGKLLVEEVA
jgi:hypothetical protein